MAQYTRHYQQFAKAAEAWGTANPEKRTAHKMVANRVAMGLMRAAKDLTCVDCNKRAQEYDHYLGYTKEHRFDVEPVCKRCHVLRGPLVGR